MKVALLADIHGNLVALETVLADLGREDVDQVVCLGDLAAKGPQPHEVVERIRSLDCVTVMGNTDESLLDPGLRAEVESLSGDQRCLGDFYLWNLERLTPDDLSFMRGCPPAVTLDLSGRKEMLCYHGTPKSLRGRILATTPEEELEAELSDFRAEVFAGGHTHQQLLRWYKGAIVTNPGAVFGGSIGPEVGATEYAIVVSESERLEVSFRRLSFDLGKLVGIARTSGIPHFDWWLSNL